MCDCMVCERIDRIKSGKNPYFVRELNTGYVVMGDCQRFTGYTLFLCKQHETELHFLAPEFRDEFLHEMSVVAEAVYHAFQPEKLNYELLGAGERRSHALAYLSQTKRRHAQKRTGLAAGRPTLC